MKRLYLAIALALACATAQASNHALVPKWSQQPDMNLGTDWLSMHRVGGPVVVDDFGSDGRPIYGFRWWGSYFQNDPGLPSGASRQVDFEISFHPNCPAGADCDGNGQPDYSYSTPGQPYAYQLVPAQESLFGTTQGGQTVYEYWALLATPWLEEAGNIYWADIAWVAGQFDTDPNASIWGWHESDQHWNDDAVTTNCAIAPNCPAGNPHFGGWTALTHQDGTTVDMAFEVLTKVPEPATLGLLGLGLLGLGFMRRRAA